MSGGLKLVLLCPLLILASLSRQRGEDAGN